MKIALLSHEYPAETGFGGIGTYTWYHARALVALGHEVHVLAGSVAPSPLRTSEHDGVQVHRIRVTGLAMRGFASLGRLGWWWTKNRLETALCMSRGLRELDRTRHFDVIEMPECGGEGRWIAGHVNAPTVIRLHSPARLIMPFYPVPRADRVLCSRIEERAMAQATALTSCSAYLAREARTQLQVESPIRVITNGLDLALFDREAPTDLATRGVWPGDGLTIFFAGRLERRKGIHLCREIISTVRARHPVTFVFAGEDLFGYAERELLPAMEAQGLQGAVRFLGKLGLADVRTAMRLADVVLLPSLWENCPYSCLEAMSAGRAVVASDQGGMPELIRDGETGLLARTGDAADFARQIVRLIEDERLRSRIGAAARRAVEERHTAERVAKESVTLYEEILRHGTGSPDESR